jgi:predicted nucleic acid-binding protein
MTVHLDTSVLIRVLGSTDGIDLLEEAHARGDRLAISALALFEWLRGSHTSEQLIVQQRLFPDAGIVWFGASEARTAALVYRNVPRARPRQADIAIAACAIEYGAALWTLNPKDFEDIPGLTLYRG